MQVIPWSVVVVCLFCACTPMERTSSEPEAPPLAPGESPAPEPRGPDASVPATPSEPTRPEQDTPPPPWTPAWTGPQSQVENFELSFDETTWRLVNDPSTSEDYAPGRFKARGVEYAVGMRLRGDQAFFHPKKSWKVELPEGQKLDGARHLNFLAEWLDAGLLTDAFSYELMHVAGAHAPRARYVTLTVNGRFEGVFMLVEQVDKSFLKAHGLPSDSSIYRCGSKDCEMRLTPKAHYQSPWDKKTQEDLPWDDLNTFLWKISRTPEHEFEAFLREHLDLDAYLRYLAVGALISISGIDDSGSYLVRDPKQGRWLYVPWDLNNSKLLYYRYEPVGTDPSVKLPLPAYTAYDTRQERIYQYKEEKYGGAHLPFSVLNQRIWDCPALRARVLDTIETLMATVFTEEATTRRIDEEHALIRDLLPKDPYVVLPAARYAPEYLKRYVTRRRAFIQQQLPLERHRGEGGVVINAFGILPGAAVDAQGRAAGYIELYNREDTPVALGGMTFTDDLSRQFKHRLPKTLVVPAHGTLRLVADGAAQAGAEHLPFKLSTQGGELGLFDGQRMTGVVDLTFHAPLSPGQAYGRLPDGAEAWGWHEAR
ncbi:CotH kinase family protein [Archangium primigenium]|uniref:CotH kinase family protein n=1 Tax=[Archangium] primigenium TaxID=2792470 RepID=UPI00195D300F|nr:CotH kinase family protein [Archangium primigenium]MBM7114358.1 CotH kinase family protein [Archangium primigenium]